VLHWSTVVLQCEKHELSVLCVSLSRSPQLATYKPGTVLPQSYPTLA
jgi:hypothetical protein